MPDPAAVAAELRRVAAFLDDYARAGTDRPDVLAAGAAELMHLASGLLGAGDGTSVAVTFDRGS